MSTPDVYIAFDTSAYTTSVAACADGRVLFDGRKMLDVPRGGRGLRQSEAVFAHVKNLRAMLCEPGLRGLSVRGVAFSERPCPAERSYMPVFCVGGSHAAAFAAAAGALLYPLTHQHGHIWAALLGQDVQDGAYGAFHVSGGTLDILRVALLGGVVTDVVRIGGTLDITCGQLIDRVGVRAGLPFPSGAEMERLYQKGAAPLAVHVDGLRANLSGAETQAVRRLDAGEPAARVCGAVIDCVAMTLGLLVKNAAAQTGLCRFIFTGGVMANAPLRAHIADVCAQSGIGCLHAQRQYCGDNACGLALAAHRLHSKGEKT